MRFAGNYFFFFGFFFFIPLLGVATGVLGVLETWPEGVPLGSGVCGGSIGFLFCIFCIRERFSASNRLRNTEEYVLNFKH